MSETAAGVKWEGWENYGCDNGVIYRGDIFTVRLRDNNWWAHNGTKLVEDNYAPDFATAKRDAERWILEREGRLPATDDGGGWIACSERMPELNAEVEVRCVAIKKSNGWYGAKSGPPDPTHWRPLPVDPHAVAACLFGDDRPTLEQARAATLHVAGCAECRAKLESKGGA